MSESVTPPAETAVGALADPVRRRLYDYTVAQSAEVTRDQASAALEISRALAAYHLDKLVEVGLLEARFSRDPGRGGPGAGRPTKRYLPSEREVAVSYPPRNYDLLSKLFAAAADALPEPQFRAALAVSSEQSGRELGGSSSSVTDALETVGYQPVTDEQTQETTLRNCPFHNIAKDHPELVCGLNESFIKGVLNGAGADPDLAELDPAPGRCCVIIHNILRSH